MLTTRGITIEPGNPALSRRRNVVVKPRAVLADGLGITCFLVIEEVQDYVVIFIRNTIKPWCSARGVDSSPAGEVCVG